MGIFDLFKKKEEPKKEILVYAPIDGEMVNLENVPDKTFAAKLLGDGVAVLPSESGNICSPVDGKLIQLFKTGHAFTVETKEGVNVLVHFGVNTVELNGEGFEKLVEEGIEVKAGDPIVKYNYEYLLENATSVMCPVIILDSEEYVIEKTIEEKNQISKPTVVLKIKK